MLVFVSVVLRGAGAFVEGLESKNRIIRRNSEEEGKEGEERQGNRRGKGE